MSADGKYGGLSKCPSCGAPVATMSAKCEECGYEFASVSGNDTAKTLMHMLDKVDATTKNPTTNTSRKVQIIQNFPVPNTKADLLEMLTLCNANKEAKTANKQLQAAWAAKTDQLIAKTEMLLKDDKEAQEILNKISARKAKKSKNNIITLIIIAIIVAGGIVAICVTNCSSKQEIQTQNTELINIRNEASNLIQKQEYDDAFDKLNEINDYMVTHGIDKSQFKETAGDVYQKLVIALIREDDLEGAALVGLDYREKLNNESEWKNSQIFKILVQECEVRNVDDSPLR